MKILVAIFAMTSAALTLGIFYYNLKIVRMFKKDEKLTATKLVIKEKIPDAFMVLSLSSLFFSLGAFLGAGTLILDMPVFNYFSELGILTMMVGLLTFMKRISDSVTEGEETELEDEGKSSSEDEDSEEEEGDTEPEDEQTEESEDEETKEE